MGGSFSVLILNSSLNFNRVMKPETSGDNAILRNVSYIVGWHWVLVFLADALNLILYQNMENWNSYLTTLNYFITLSPINGHLQQILVL